MNGSPAKMGTISGTAGHSSALKMRVEQMASALKQTETETKSDPYADAKKKDPNLDTYIAERKKYRPGSDEYEANQAKINAAYGKVRSKTLKAAQIAKVNKEAPSAKDATERKVGVKRDSIIGDENKDGNMLTRWLNKQRNKKKKNNVSVTARKDEEEKQGKRGKKGTPSRGGNIFK